MNGQQRPATLAIEFLEVGRHNYSGSSNPACSRIFNSRSDGNDRVGFRPALFM